MVATETLHRVLGDGQGDLPVGDIASPLRVLASPGEPLHRVTLRLGSAGDTRCPVVESAEAPRLVGFLAPSDILRARVGAARQAETDFDPLGA
jgi:hypothetical protein